MITLDTPVEKMKFVGEKILPKLHHLGIKTIRDLLWYFPNRHEDFAKFVNVDEIEEGEKISIHGIVKSTTLRRSPRRRMTIVTVTILDQLGTPIKATWFNQPYLKDTFRSGMPITLSGKAKLDRKYGLYLTSPAYEKTSGDLRHTGGLIPIYSETAGLSSKYLRFLIKPALSLIKTIQDPLDPAILKRHNLVSLPQAIQQVHFPESEEDAEKAKQRLAFDELFLFQLQALVQRRKAKLSPGISIPFDKDAIGKFVKSLPFELTTAQRISVWEILNDIQKQYPMNRLLNGDVGSGKTVVAAAAAFQSMKSGFQTAFMAPTEVLANQHFDSLKEPLRGWGLRIGLITGSSAKVWEDDWEYETKKPNFVELLKNGEIDLAIGTHALIQNGVEFKNLALTIIDEQHRFGVDQRATLAKMTNDERYPHLLSMTATPIPRTLALTIYGDLDFSLLDEMPKGRQKIITKIIKPKERGETYEFLREEVKNGRQVFVICPRIEINNDIAENVKQKKLVEADTKAVKEEYKKLSEEIFPDLTVAMLHGKMKSKEKEVIMKDFKEGITNILVSTSVIEVGVDIPNATVMMIEGAEKFGLAQLHQFRGRVGRGEYQSYALLFVESPEVKTTRRLDAMVKYNDGFKLAEMDMKIRGPGDFIGTKQSGMPDLTMASLSDMTLIKKARTEVQLLLKKDPELKNNPILRSSLRDFKRRVHLE
jgi:ATP-dependent DNA helicase RecG